jgi:predicted nucleotide-binding protein (sugar kinase/HSP70/actin superfamily)
MAGREEGLGSSNDSFDVVDVDAELARFAAEEAARLGIPAEKPHWEDLMTRADMTRKERDETTLLIGGLTMAHDFLVEGALSGLGYRVKHMEVPNLASLNVGKEFGNRGQCNPTYFTVGNLIKTLQTLQEEEGLTTEQLKKKYVFFTAGACGPCRFGMYVTEYRKALRDAGYDGFRVFLFQQAGGLKQATGDDLGIELSPPFFIGIVKALLCGDVLNALAYRIRPYEVEAGATDRAMANAKKILYDTFASDTSIKSVFPALLKVRREFKKVAVDRLRVKPKASIIGEFWAMTTEGDGNYHLQRFLESEGAENEIQILINTLLYNLWEETRDTRVRAELRGEDGGKFGLEGKGAVGARQKLATMRVADALLRGLFKGFGALAGLHDYALPDMEEIASVADKYYSNDLRGGEGHMEVGKLIVNGIHKKAHITVSVKPFGCMPSASVSDGVASLVSDRFPDSVFCAVETSGDGKVNFYSRIQMYLFKARAKAEAEFEIALKENGVTRAQCEEFLRTHPRFASSLHRAPHRYAGTAADLVAEIAPYMTQSVFTRTKNRLVRRMRQAGSLGPKLATGARELYAQRQEIAERLRADAEVAIDALAGRNDRLGPLLADIAARLLARNDEHMHTEAPATIRKGKLPLVEASTH